MTDTGLVPASYINRPWSLNCTNCNHREVRVAMSYCDKVEQHAIHFSWIEAKEGSTIETGD